MHTRTPLSCILNNMLDTTKSPEGVVAFKPNLTCSGKAFLLITQITPWPALSPALLTCSSRGRSCSGSAALPGWCPAAVGLFGY